jgi:nucleoid DNA-binding protein
MYIIKIKINGKLMTMTKRDLVMKVSEETGVLQKEASRIVQNLLDSLADEIAAGRTVELRNFGVFEVKVAKSRVGRNPNQPEKEVTIPERCVAKFRAGLELKARMEKLDPKNI